VASSCGHGSNWLAYGAWVRRHQRSREARKHLTDAHTTLNRLGMNGFASRAARGLRAAGGTDPRRSGASALTPQELQIAQLPAEGLSNRQIGEQLFLSDRTVGSHPYHIYPKLEISTRAQLALALRGSAATSM
jgi:DNA-binding NarL/FixJ family response regulator